MATFSRALTTLTLAGALVLTLSGCSLEALMSNSHEDHFADYESAAEKWVGSEIPGWIPTDATGIRRLATRDERISVIRVESRSTPRGDCTEQPREGVPVLTASWTAAERPDVVTVCGGYEIMPTDTGWLGWLYDPEEPGRLS